MHTRGQYSKLVESTEADRRSWKEWEIEDASIFRLHSADVISICFLVCIPFLVSFEHFQRYVI